MRRAPPAGRKGPGRRLKSARSPGPRRHGRRVRMLRASEAGTWRLPRRLRPTRHRPWSEHRWRSALRRPPRRARPRPDLGTSGTGSGPELSLERPLVSEARDLAHFSPQGRTRGKRPSSGGVGGPGLGGFQRPYQSRPGVNARPRRWHAARCGKAGLKSRPPKGERGSPQGEHDVSRRSRSALRRTPASALRLSRRGGVCPPSSSFSVLRAASASDEAGIAGSPLSNRSLPARSAGRSEATGSRRASPPRRWPP